MNIKKTIIYFFLLFVSLLKATGGYAQQNKIDSLGHFFATEKNDSLRLTALIQLGRAYLTSNSPKAEGYARQCIGLAKQKRLDASEASGWGLLGIVFYYRGEFPEAIEKYQKALAINTILLNEKSISSLYRNIALCYTRMGTYSKAVDYNFRSLKIAEEENDSAAIGNLSNDIGNVFFYQADYVNAGKYYEKALAIYRAGNARVGMAQEMNNIGSVNSELKNYKKALVYYTQAFEIRSQIKDTAGLISCLTNIGQIHGLDGDRQGSLKNGFEALRLSELSRNNDARASALSDIANTYGQMKNYPQAVIYGEQSLKLSEAQHDMNDIRSIHEVLSGIYEGAHNTDKALYHYKQFIALRDSLLNQENTKKSIQSLMLYEFNKKQAADSMHNIELVQVESLKHQQEIHQQKTYTYGGILGFALMLIVAGVSFRAYRQKQKANELVNEQKELVEEKQREILASIHYAKRIQESLLPTEKYISRNMGRLKNEMHNTET